MQKFTVFTVILTILVVVVSAETFVNKYLPSLKADITSPLSNENFNLPQELNLNEGDKEIEIANDAKIMSNTDTALLGLDNIQTFDPKIVETQYTGIRYDTGAEIALQNPEISSQNPEISLQNPEISSQNPGISLPKEVVSGNSANNSSKVLFDIESFSGGSVVAPTLRGVNETMLLNSGFIGAHIEKEDFDGMLYKTVALDDLIGIDVDKLGITDGTNSFAKIYVIKFSGTTALEDTYNVIKLRASQGIDVQVNETNEFGLGSFYMNDVRRSGVAFLTVKIGNELYGFSYPKQYHPQIKNLISLLLVDF